MGYNSFLSRFIAMFTLSQIWPLGSFHTGSCVFSPVSFILRALPYLPTQPDAPGWSYTSYSFHTLAQVPLSGLKSKPNRNYSPTLKSEVQTTYAVLSPTLFKGVSGLKSKWWRTFFFFFCRERAVGALSPTSHGRGRRWPPLHLKSNKRVFKEDTWRMRCVSTGARVGGRGRHRRSWL